MPTYKRHSDLTGDELHENKPHTHPISEVTGLETDLANKADSSHTHSASDVTDFDTEVGNNTDVAANTSARHSHSNKALLDTYTQTEANLADAVSKKHSHSNQTALDNVSGVNTGDQDLSGYSLTSHTHTLDNLSDVAVTTPTSGQVLKYNGTTWVNDTDAGGGGAWGTITGTLSDQTDLQTALDAKAVDTSVVHDTGDETIAGVKTFSSSPVVPDPTTDTQAASKKYVDDSITAAGGYTDEAAQDAVGGILTDSSEIDLTYNDATPSISASLVAGSIDETKLDTSVNASLDLADTAVQDLADLGITATATELNYTDGVTSAIQTQLDGKASSSDLSTHISDTTTHGTTGDIVGTSDTQTLTNKTLTSPVLTTPKTDTISENTAAAGVTIDGVLLKDMSLTVYQINATNGVNVIFNHKIQVDEVIERTSAAGVTVDGVLIKDGTVDGRDLSTDGTKLDGIETGADVTDTTNVDAAGAVMNADTTTASMAFVVDEDDMASNSATKVPTQQSVKAYVDANAGAGGSTDGWTEAGETWTYASATTFTVSGDQTAKYQKGTRIKLTQTTVKYFVVTNSTHSGGTTTVTITGGTDYTLANAAITDNYYSYQANPQGYPAQFTLSSNQWLSIQGKQITLTGWGYEQGNGANFYTSGQTVSFGLTFASRPVVLISSAGYKDGSNPTHIGDTGGSWEVVNYTVGNITTTSFKALAGRTDGTAIPSSYRILYTWLAIGAL